jgi:phosphate transport system permease protein
VARVVLAGAACLILVLLVAIFAAMYQGSALSIEKFGWAFVTSADWNPVTEQYGALSSIYGTVVSTVLAMLLAVPLSLLIALFLVELAPRWLSAPIGMAVELLAAVPSIIYGMWGLFVLAPLLANRVEPWIQGTGLGSLPLFSGPPIGLGMLNASLVLAVMILPFITAISRDVFRSVPRVMREAAYGLGGTTWEVTRYVTLRYGRRGIIGACLLALGRAMGETMAVTYVIGNSNTVPQSWRDVSLFATGNTISSKMASEFMEATDRPLQLSALVQLGFILLILSVLAQALAQLWMAWSAARVEGR